MKTWLHSFQIPPKFLIDSRLTLLDNLIGVIDKAATNAGCPSSHASTNLAPTFHAFTIGGNIIVVTILLGYVNMLYFIAQQIFFFHDKYAVSLIHLSFKLIIINN
jgi:hypothetical protein